MLGIVCLSLRTCQFGNFSIAQCIVNDFSHSFFFFFKLFLSVPRLVILQKQKNTYTYMAAMMK